MRCIVALKCPIYRNVWRMSSSSLPLLDFKSVTLYALRLVLQSADSTALLASLRQRLEEAGDFFDGEPVVIDAGALDAAPDWKGLARLLAHSNMPLVGVSAPDELHSSVRKAGLAVVSLPPMRETGGSVHRDVEGAEPVAAQATGAARKPDMSRPAAGSATLVAQPGMAEAAPARPAPTAIPAIEVPQPADAGADAPRPTLVLDRSLRSGQKVYARGADLIVVGMVSPGAEVIADGNIHVYGPLRGKAMAGARGDEAARIFTTHLDAELVAVAGIYRVVDTALPADVLQRTAAVRLQDGELRIEALAQ